MDILNQKNHLQKFEPSNDKWQNPLSCREGRKMKLIKSQKTKDAFAFSLDVNIYETNLDTDFILDIQINNLFEFKTDNILPTSLELYDLYLIANTIGNEKIFDEANEKDISIDVTVEPRSYNEMKDGLETVIQKYRASLQ